MKLMLQDWGQYAYIPDVRQLNAAQAAVDKDERAQRANSYKRLRTQKSLKKSDRDHSASRNEPSFQLSDANPI